MSRVEKWCVRMMGHGVDPLPFVRKVSYREFLATKPFTVFTLAQEPSELSTGAAIAITAVIIFIIAFILGALTSALVICLCYNPRRLKAPQTSTSTSGTTSALPPGPVYEELTTGDKKRADQMEMKGNVAYGPSKNKLPLEQYVAYEPLSV